MFYAQSFRSSNPSMGLLVHQGRRDFSLKMRKVNLKYARVKKYKLKTKKAFQKRFDLVMTYLPPPGC
jgi:hypothetical protein